MLFIPKDLILDQIMTNIDVATWCLCDIVVNSSLKESDLITVSQIVYQMHHTVDINRNTKEEIGIAIQHLLEENYLIGERQGKQYYEIFRDSFYMEENEFFVKAHEDDIRKIFKHLRPFTALRVYLYLLSTINPKTKCSSWNKEQLAELIGKDTTTITRYNKFFEDEKLLYIYRANSTKDGVYFSNIYSRYEDWEAAKAYGDSRSGSNGNANLKRRYAQMYNMIKSGRKEYSADEMQELRDYCEAENARRQKIYDKNPSYDQKFFDISVLV